MSAPHDRDPFGMPDYVPRIWVKGPAGRWLAARPGRVRADSGLLR
jgi:hypothetical protein